MAASISNSETQNGSDKKRIKFDEEIFRDVDKFPVNFSGVPHIGERIFGYLDFKDFNSCRTVCKDWFNLLHGNRSSWIKLLEKEKVRKIKLSSEDLDSDVFSVVKNCQFYLVKRRLRGGRGSKIADFEMT